MTLTKNEKAVALLSVATLMIKYSINANDAAANSNDAERCKIMRKNGIDGARASALCQIAPIQLIDDHIVSAPANDNSEAEDKAKQRRYIATNVVKDLESINNSDRGGNRRSPLPFDFPLCQVVSRQLHRCLINEDHELDQDVLNILKLGGFAYDTVGECVYTNKGFIQICME